MRIIRTFLPLVVACLFVAQVSCSSKSKPADNQPANVAATPVAEATPAEELEEGDTQFSAEARAAFERGQDLSQMDHDEEAIEAFKQAVNLEPGYAEAYFRMAYSYTVLGKKDEAEAAFEKAAKAYEKFTHKNPKNARAQFNMGLAYGKLLKPEEAVKALKQAVKLAPENGEFYYELGLAQSKLADYDEALNAFQKAIDLDPDLSYRAEEDIEKAKLGKQRKDGILKQQETLLKKKGKPRNTNSTENTNVAPPKEPRKNPTPAPPPTP